MDWCISGFRATSDRQWSCVKVVQNPAGTAPRGNISLADGYKQEWCSISWSSSTRWSHLISNVCVCVWMSLFPLQRHKQPVQTMSDSFTSSSDINENASLSSTDRREADNSGRESPPSDATLTSRLLFFFPHPECVCVWCHCHSPG